MDPSDLGASFVPKTCGQPTAIGTVEALIKALPDDWVYACDSPNTPFPVSADLQLVSELVLDAVDIPLPERCKTADPSTCRPWLQIQAGTLGAEAVETRLLYGGSEVLTRVRLNPGVYRFRPMTFFTSLSTPLVHVMVVIPGCDATCPQEALRCPTDLVCYSEWVWPESQDFSFFCHNCYGAPVSVCACWTPSGPKADGTPCQKYPACPDNGLSTCLDGRCL